MMSESLWPHGLQHARLPYHQLPELAQTHVHWVRDAIQPFHPLLFPSPPAFNLFQYWGLFKWVSSLHQVARVLELELQHQSFQWIFRTDFLSDLLVWSPCSPRDSQESSPASNPKMSILHRSAFIMVDLSHLYLDYWKNYIFNYADFCRRCLCFLTCCLGFSQFFFQGTSIF